MNNEESDINPKNAGSSSSSSSSSKQTKKQKNYSLVSYPRKRQRVGNPYQAKIPPYYNNNSADNGDDNKKSIRWIRSSLLQQQKDNNNNDMDHDHSNTSSLTSSLTDTSNNVSVTSSLSKEITKSCVCIHKASLLSKEENKEQDLFLSYVFTQLFLTNNNNNDDDKKNIYNNNIKLENILTYLQTKHHGNINAAKVHLQVQLSCGKATKHRMLIHKRLKEMMTTNNKSHDNSIDDDNDVNVKLLSSWKERYQVMCDFSWNRLWGDLRHDHSHDDVMKQDHTSWKDIFRELNTIINKIENHTDSSKPSMDILSKLLHKAYHYHHHKSSTKEETITNQKFHSLLDIISLGRDYLARVLDAAYTSSDLDSPNSTTIDLANIKSELEIAKLHSPVLFTEVDVLQSIVNRALQWEKDVENIDYNNNSSNNNVNVNDTLTIAETLLKQVHTELNIFPHSIINLQKRVNKAQDLRNRIQIWNNDLKKSSSSSSTQQEETTQNKSRMLSSFVKELNKIQLSFYPESTKIQNQHKELEDWMERAIRAMRIKVSLPILQMIIQEGSNSHDKLPFIPDDIIDKLKSKTKLAHNWILKFQRLVFKKDDTDTKLVSSTSIMTSSSDEDKLSLLAYIRLRLHDQDPDLINKFSSQRGALIHLFNEGMRIPVDISEWNLLKFELDAFDWSFEAKKKFDNKKKMKMDDVDELLHKATLLRDKLCLKDKSKKEKWELEYEKEWINVMKIAHAWLEKADYYLDNDNNNDHNIIEDTNSNSFDSDDKSIDTNDNDNNNDNDQDLIINNDDDNNTISMIELRNWYLQGENLSINFGNPFLRVQKVIDNNIEPWLIQYHDLLLVCQIISQNDTSSIKEKDNIKTMDGKNMSLTQISTAISCAPCFYTNNNRNKKVFIEVIKLQSINQQIHKWSEQVLIAVPFRQRSKRVKISSKHINNNNNNRNKDNDKKNKNNKQNNNNQKKKNKQTIITIKHLQSLLNTSNELKTNLQIINDDKIRIEQQLQNVKGWQLNAQCDLRSLMEAFAVFQKERDLFIKNEEDKGFFKINYKSYSASLNTTNPNSTNNSSISNELKSSTSSLSTNHHNTNTNVNHITTPITNCIGRQKVCQIISSLLDGALQLGIFTIEQSIAEYLDTSVINWCCRVGNILPFEVLQRCNFDELDEIIKQGHDLSLHPTRSMIDKDGNDNSNNNNEDLKGILDALDQSWMVLVNKELVRLDMLRKGRNAYFDWVKEVEKFLSSADSSSISSDNTNKVPVTTLDNLILRSKQYPSTLETVRKLQKEVDLIDLWTKDTQQLLTAFFNNSRTMDTTTSWSNRSSSSDVNNHKISMDDAKLIISKGEKLRVIPAELKTLKQHARLAKNWSNKVNKIFRISNSSSSSTTDKKKLHSTEINKSLHEHDTTFIINMADEVVKLKSLVKEYCLCRGPHHGFMICCDNCEEWYHGSCIGISSAQAERVQKYRCVKCCIVQNYKDSYNLAFEIIKKWKKNPEELKAHRRSLFQKHQRKINKERRDIEMKSREAEVISHQLMTTQQNERLRIVQSMSRMNNYNNNAPVVVTPNDTTATISTPISDHSSIAQQQQRQINNNSINSMVVKSIEEARLKLENIRSHLVSSSKRLERLLNEERGMIIQVATEDNLAPTLHPWLHKVLTFILVPSTAEEANKSRPKQDGSLSEPMLKLLMEAQATNIIKLQDIGTMSNTFINISWCLRALDILCQNRRLTWEEIDSLLIQSKDCTLPDERGLRILRGIAQRSMSMRKKVKNALAPIPGETKPFDLKFLSELHFQAKSMPIIVSEESMLVSTIEDKGTRYCICGGASDGRFMICCDKCDLWFHGECVQQSVSSNTTTCWLCPTCSTLDAAFKKNSTPNITASNTTTTAVPAVEEKINSKASASTQKVPKTFDDEIKSTNVTITSSDFNFDKTPFSNSSSTSNATDMPINLTSCASSNTNLILSTSKISNAPDPDKLWPPIGLSNSSLAQNMFGSILNEKIIGESNVTTTHNYAINGAKSTKMF